MNCATIRETLLSSERPDLPGMECDRHLAGCPSCRVWLRRVVHLERRLADLHVPVVPVPPALLTQLEDGPLDGRLVRLRDQRLPLQQRRREEGRRKLALAFALAAALLVLAVGLWAWPTHHQEPIHADLVVYHARRDRHVDSARTPAGRLKRLSGLAVALLDEARQHGDDPEHLATIARQFEILARQDLPRFAGDVPPAGRGPVLEDVAARLRRCESDASRLAAECETDRPWCAESLREMAASARAGEMHLRRLLRQDRG